MGNAKVRFLLAPGALCRPGHRADRFAGAFTCLLYHWRSAHPTLDEPRTEALCRGLLALAQLHAGQVHNSLGSGRRALALAQESKNVWVEVISTFWLTYGLLDAGAYEEALMLTQHAVALARRTFPRRVILQDLLTALGSTYQALQQWDEARSILEEVEAVAETLGLGPYGVLIHHWTFNHVAGVAETLGLGPYGVPTLSQLCVHYALAGEWEAAYRYALKAIAIRKRSNAALIVLDFSQQYETEVLLREGDERQAREAVQRLGEDLRPYPRYRLPYLRSLAALAAWEGQREQAIGHLREVARLAADLGVPGERWQIQAALARVYEAEGLPEQAHTAWASAARIIQGLAEGIRDEALRSRFLAGPQIQPVVQHAQSEVSPVPSKMRPRDRESEKDLL